jgi:hypothetical protein
VPLTLHLAAKLTGGQPRTVNVAHTFTESWPLSACR